ncbi:hypothetical protein NMG60_11023064 [Bertholletia excelsa]
MENAPENLYEVRVEENNVHENVRVRRVIIGGRGRRGPLRRHGRCSCSYNLEEVSQGAREQGCISFAAHRVGFLITSVIGLLQLKYQNQDLSPFETHPITMQALIVTICAYCLLATARNHSSEILDQLNLLLGALSSLLLLSILLPSFLTCFFFVMWTFLFLIMGRPLLQTIYAWFCHRTALAVSLVLNVYTR